jgi:hypothetical protein
MVAQNKSQNKTNCDSDGVGKVMNSNEKQFIVVTEGDAALSDINAHPDQIYEFAGGESDTVFQMIENRIRTKFRIYLVRIPISRSPVI